MSATIYSFTKALLTPAGSFATLGAMTPTIDEAGVPQISRTARFAECEVGWLAERWLVCMPLTAAAISEIERTAAHLATLRSEWLADYRLLRGELRYYDSTGEEHRTDIVLQRMVGQPFSKALETENPNTLLNALDSLETELTRLGLSHRNLKVENLRWNGNKILPIRHHYSRMELGGDTKAFESLRIDIARQGGGANMANDLQSSYEPLGDSYTGHLWVSHQFEQLVCVEDTQGWGYVDSSNRIVIPSQFRWADDFHEGRAAVETETGMGLIDKQGHYIIPAQYEIVEYDHTTGRSKVRHAGLWAEFDYQGLQLTPFEAQTALKTN